ncbi:c-type cytochrome [Maritimibacter alkaliphilus]|uniref:c-type cytochrome n=1 Tax=Maritimibacter alkaliphilus TaxID=404236 RepID=UPI001C980D50|nr:c-type cytochrome [Maritimibacter alkaliphilus]MBY6091548.1 c-type cytochrome [Maritimibacter alkaliphilus]
MSKCPKLAAALLISGLALPVQAETLGLGRPALPEEIAAWDLDVRPDGLGLPEGSGDVWTGDEVFSERCASCHGDFAEGRGNWPKLAGGQGTLDHKDPLKTVGSYWPYLSTVWDYVHRSMPFGDAQSLTADEVYAITAYILYSNDIVGDNFTLSKETFSDVVLPNTEGFIVDDRAETEYTAFSGEPCMTDCKDTVEITMRAAVLDVTPDTEEASSEPVVEAAAEAPAETPAEAPAAEAPATPEPAAASMPDPALVADGEKVFRKCKACHEVGAGAKNRTGPELNGIVGRTVAAVDGFRYSKPMDEMGASGTIWSMDELHAFLANPKKHLKGTKMSFPGLKKDADIDAVIAYLQANGG